MVKIKKIQNRNVELFFALIIEFIEFYFICYLNYNFFKVSIINIFSILTTFFICKLLIKKLGYKNGHYKIKNYFDVGWRRCLFFTSIFITGYFLISNIDLHLGILLTIFGSLVTSNIFDINDINEFTQGKKKNESEYQQIYLWVRYNQNDTRILEVENNIKRDKLLYKIYRNMFIESKSPMEMANILNLKSDIVVYPYVNRIIGILKYTIYEIEEICDLHSSDNILQ